MSDREAIGHDVGRTQEGAVQAEGLEHELLQDILVELAGHSFNHATGDAEAGIAVRPVRARWKHLRNARQSGHKPRQGIIVVPGVADDIVPAAAMGKQVAQRHAGRRILVCQMEVGQVGPDRPIEVERALLHQAQRGRGREGLGDGANLKERVRIDRERVLHARHAEPGGVFSSFVEDPQRDARRLGALHRLPYHGFWDWKSIRAGRPLRETGAHIRGRTHRGVSRSAAGQHAKHRRHAGDSNE
jgi:hypothetical protein